MLSLHENKLGTDEAAANYILICGCKNELPISINDMNEAMFKIVSYFLNVVSLTLTAWSV